MQFISLTNEDSTIILAGLYDVVSDFHALMLKKLPSTLSTPGQGCPPTKKTSLGIVMLVTIILFKFFVGHRSWKEYYRFLKSYHHGKDIGCLPAYTNFMKSIHLLSGYALIFLEAVRKYAKQGVDLQFVDSTPLRVCKIKREFTHRVALGVASKSKSTMGWYYGFKLHLVCDHRGNILAWRITTATVDDRKGLALIWNELTGMIVADAGYIGSNWQEAAQDLGVTLMAAAKKIMRKMMTRWQHALLKARQMVETVFSVVKYRLGMETSLPRSLMGYFAHYVWCLLAYQLRRFGQLEQQAERVVLTGGVA